MKIVNLIEGKAPTSDALLEQIAAARTKGDLLTAHKLSHALTNAINAEIRAAKVANAKTPTPGSDFEKLLAASNEFFGEYEALQGVSSIQELNDALYEIAHEVGEDKGWGDEGIMAYHEEDCLEAIARKAGVNPGVWDT